MDAEVVADGFETVEIFLSDNGQTNSSMRFEKSNQNRYPCLSAVILVTFSNLLLYQFSGAFVSTSFSILSSEFPYYFTHFLSCFFSFSFVWLGFFFAFPSASPSLICHETGILFTSFDARPVSCIFNVELVFFPRYFFSISLSLTLLFFLSFLFLFFLF